jgi:hypothetical protein
MKESGLVKKGIARDGVGQKRDAASALHFITFVDGNPPCLTFFGPIFV